MKQEPEFRVSVIEQVAEAMCVAARTAPKARGIDLLEIKIAYGIPLSATGKNPFFDRK